MEKRKQSNFIHALAFVGLLLLWSCGGDDNEPTPAGKEESRITAVVNGTDWASTKGSFKLGTRTITDGASAFAGAGDTLTIVGVQVQGADTTAILLKVKLSADKVGTYKIRSAGSSDGARAYYLNGLSAGAINTAVQNYGSGITNGNLRISEYDVANSSVSGDFSFSMAASGQTTYTVVAGAIQNVAF
ncbi:hypothetical protein ACXYMU_02405 [Pontibacter sp. CAU 1760]